jgi:SAM-dependent methyltransferase
MIALVCRSCGSPLTRTVVDLGDQPLANSYLVAVPTDDAPEPVYPLHARVCDNCLLVQVEAAVSADAIFSDYAYFSSYSTSWVEHARRYAVAATQSLGLNDKSLVVEIASNDGYLLKHFVGLGVGVLGVEPAANVADVARAAGVPTDTRFFGVEYASEFLGRSDPPELVVANNVFAHVPDLNDFVAGLALLVQGRGVLSIEAPHLLRMFERTEFDTIYHEHFSYYSLLSARNVLAIHGLEVFDVEELPTHGGSLRIWAAAAGERTVTPRVAAVIDAEVAYGLDTPASYERFAAQVAATLAGFDAFLATARAENKRVVAYGAAAKGNTFMNAAGVTPADIAYVVDMSPHKQDHFMPGSHLPIRDPAVIRQDRPDYLLILPWNLRTEIESQMSDIREWGARFVVAVPEIEEF